MPELKDIAKGKLSTRESLIREIQGRVKADLNSQEGAVGTRLDGPLGEQIAISSGSWLLEYTLPEHVAEGVCAWLEKTFLQSPQDFGPRTDGQDSSSSAKTPEGNNGGGDARVAAPKPKRAEGRAI